MGLVPWIAEGATWGARANTSPHNGAHLDITSSFFSLHFPEERGGGRGGAHNGKHVSSTFQLQLPACPLPARLSLAHQLVPTYSLLLGATTSGPPAPPLLPPGLDGQSLCMTDLSLLFTLNLFLSLALGSPQPGRQRARGGTLYKHRNTWLPGSSGQASSDPHFLGGGKQN